MARQTTNTHCRQSMWCSGGKLSTVAQLLLATAMLSVKVAAVAISSPELSMGGVEGSADTRDAALAAFDAEKRSSWQSLQGSWGKRGAAAPDELDDELVDNWIPILIDNGNVERTATNPLLYLVNAATLERLAHERQTNEGIRAAEDFLSSSAAVSSEAADAGNNGMMAAEKRAWKSLNAGWGKRRNAPAWNKFSGAWGKREPGWNNLKGMWGKRASKDWQKLHAGWGKRSQSFPEMN